MSTGDHVVCPLLQQNHAVMSTGDHVVCRLLQQNHAVMSTGDHVCPLLQQNHAVKIDVLFVLCYNKTMLSKLMCCLSSVMSTPCCQEYW